MACSAGACTATAKAAVLNVTDLQSMLADGNVTVSTGSGAIARQADDIVVTAGFTWTSSHLLTLDAFRSISVEQPVVVAGAGGVSLTTNGGGTGGVLEFRRKGNIGFWGTGNSLSVNGTAFTLAATIDQLVSAIKANRGGAFALAADLDASRHKVFKRSPLPFLSGTLEGLGHTIANLSISVGSGNAGFIAAVEQSALVENLSLEKEVVAGNADVGGLAGFSKGHIRRVRVEGTIHQLSGAYSAGGIVGFNKGIVEQASSGATVYGAGYTEAGEIAGNSSGPIESSTATGWVFGGYAAGGIVGSGGIITNSNSSASVTGTTYVGGVAGQATAITNCRASGPVTGLSDSKAGGLVGQIYGSISGSSATGSVTATGTTVGVYAGGLVGQAAGPVSQSFATGNVSISGVGPELWAGGFAGVAGNIENSYATGAVTATAPAIIGGFVGVQYHGPIQYSYSSGAVSGAAGSRVGGFAGAVDVADQISDAYWDTTTSGTKTGVADGNTGGVAGLTTAQFVSGLPPGFDASVWGENSAVIRGLPYLLGNPPPAQIAR